MQQYQERLKKLQGYLKENGCDGLLVEDKINLYYLTGLDLSAGKLYALQSGAFLFVDSRYYEICKKSSPFPIHPSEKYPSMEQILDLPEFSSLKNLAFCNETTSYREFQKLQKEAGDKISLKGLENPVAKLRMIKDPSEIQTLREAGELGSEGFDFVCSLLKEGITEAEIGVELEIFWKRKGGKTIAFDPIIAFGANSSMPHYRVGNARLSQGQNVLIDIGVNYKHYHSDMSRVVFFGDPDPKILAIHAIVQKAQKAALELCRPQALIGELDAAARKIIEQEGYGENFTHSLGHGVGLEIHEQPTLRSKPPQKDFPLLPGMVITIEPGIYLPGVGGVRIEDTVVITKNGHENLTNRPTAPVFVKN